MKRLMTLTAAALVALLIIPGPAAQAQATCPSGVELKSPSLISCERLQQCGSQGEVAVRFASAITGKGDGDMFRLLEKYRYCTQGKGSWTEQQWVDKCTQQGWKVVAYFFGTIQNPQVQFPDFVIPSDKTRNDLETTPYCAPHKTNPSRYKLYFNGNGFVYEQQHCSQDRDNNGSYETRVSGSPNCSDSHTPKWVAPWD